MTSQTQVAQLLPDRPFFRQGVEHDLFPTLRALTELHIERSPEYRRIVQGLGFSLESLQSLPFLPVSLFKRVDLASISPEDTYRIVTSSGTTGAVPSRIRLDKETARRQSLVLQGQMADALKVRERRPMLILDSRSSVLDPTRRSARAAAILGLMPLGRDHVFALNDEGNVDAIAIAEFAECHRNRPVIMFGFTFLAWRALMDSQIASLDLPMATLLHSGGWKTLASRGISNAEFSSLIMSRHGLASVRNFYGMAEQTGSIFLEGEDGLLHTSAVNDVIIRDPYTFAPLPDGEEGLIQALSIVPISYPGHSLLTEDIGVISTRVSDDPLGGRAFRILGRIPKSELRGCSDVAAGVLSA